MQRQSSPCSPRETRPRWVRLSLIVCLVTLACLVILGGGTALGARDSTAQRTRELLGQLAGGSEHPEIVKEPRQRAESLLERAEEARREDRPTHARLLDEFALEWAQIGADLQRAYAEEQKAAELERKLLEAETRRKRAEALLEETEARRGRAEALVLKLDPSVEAELPLTGNGPPLPKEPVPASAEGSKQPSEEGR